VTVADLAKELHAVRRAQQLIYPSSANLMHIDEKNPLTYQSYENKDKKRKSIIPVTIKMKLGNNQSIKMLNKIQHRRKGTGTDQQAERDAQWAP